MCRCIKNFFGLSSMKTYRVYGQYDKGPMVAVIVNAWNRADAISRSKTENPGFHPNGRVEEL